MSIFTELAPERRRERERATLIVGYTHSRRPASMSTGWFRTNSPPVVHETVNNETIVVNLDTGCYYDLNDSAGYVFGMLASSAHPEEIAQQLAARYGIDASEARGMVDELVAKLVEEQLVVPADGPPAVAAPAPQPDMPPGAFVAPVVNKYTDMQELLLLDPVHEVDEAGWPSRA
jgi:hypothetical protein